MDRIRVIRICSVLWHYEFAISGPTSRRGSCCQRKGVLCIAARASRRRDPARQPARIGDAGSVAAMPDCQVTWLPAIKLHGRSGQSYAARRRSAPASADGRHELPMMDGEVIAFAKPSGGHAHVHRTGVAARGFATLAEVRAKGGLAIAAARTPAVITSGNSDSRAVSTPTLRHKVGGITEYLKVAALADEWVRLHCIRCISARPSGDAAADVAARRWLVHRNFLHEARRLFWYEARCRCEWQHRGARRAGAGL